MSDKPKIRSVFSDDPNYPGPPDFGYFPPFAPKVLPERKVMFDDDNKPLPEFFLLLNAAAQASDAVDNYDLRSEDSESAKKFKRLLQHQTHDATYLILFVQRNGKKIIDNLDALLEDK